MVITLDRIESPMFSYLFHPVGADNSSQSVTSRELRTRRQSVAMMFLSSWLKDRNQTCGESSRAPVSQTRTESTVVSSAGTEESAVGVTYGIGERHADEELHVIVISRP